MNTSSVPMQHSNVNTARQNPAPNSDNNFAENMEFFPLIPGRDTERLKAEGRCFLAEPLDADCDPRLRGRKSKLFYLIEFRNRLHGYCDLDIPEFACAVDREEGTIVNYIREMCRDGLLVAYTRGKKSRVIALADVRGLEALAGVKAADQAKKEKLCKIRAERAGRARLVQEATDAFRGVPTDPFFSNDPHKNVPETHNSVPQTHNSVPQTHENVHGAAHFCALFQMENAPKATSEALVESKYSNKTPTISTPSSVVEELARASAAVQKVEEPESSDGGSEQDEASIEEESEESFVDPFADDESSDIHQSSDTDQQSGLPPGASDSLEPYANIHLQGMPRKEAHLPPKPRAAPNTRTMPAYHHHYVSPAAPKRARLTLGETLAEIARHPDDVREEARATVQCEQTWQWSRGEEKLCAQTLILEACVRIIAGRLVASGAALDEAA